MEKVPAPSSSPNLEPSAPGADSLPARTPPLPEPAPGTWLSGWVCLLATVFLASSTLNCLLHWLPYEHPWDLGGTVLSGLLTWLCYAWTLSDRSTVPAEKRGVVAFGLLILWSLTFPAVLWSLGLK